MAATFDKTLATNTDRNRARLLLGDTKVRDGMALLEDETIDAMIALNGFREGVAQLADNLASEFAAQPDSYDESGGVKLSWTERIDRWEKLASQLRSGEIMIEKPKTDAVAISAIAQPLTGPDMEGLEDVD